MELVLTEPNYHLYSESLLGSRYLVFVALRSYWGVLVVSWWDSFVEPSLCWVHTIN